MKRMHLFGIALCSTLFAAVLFGCDDSLPTGTDGSVIMPLKVGNRWIARETTYDQNGNVTATTMDTLSITTLVNNNGEAWYRTNTGALYTNRQDGLYMLDGCSCMQARYPAQTSDTFNTLPAALVLLPGSTEPVEQIVASRVVAVDETVDVPLGKFQTYHYAPVIIEPLNARFVREIHSYYVPDVGPVLMEEYEGSKNEAGILVKRWELMQVEL